MDTHLVVGAGPVGTATARRLLDDGHHVRVVTRSGSGPEGSERIAADAADADRLTALAEGAAAIYNCVNPTYSRWELDWPPVAAALLHAAESSGAVLATVGNLYGYGQVDAPMTEETPLAATGRKGRVRNAMWRDALAAHEAGRIRTFEVRGSDYLGGNSMLSYLVTPLAPEGSACVRPGRPRRAAHLDLHRGRRRPARHRGVRRAGVGPGLARAQQRPAQRARADRDRGRPARRDREAQHHALRRRSGRPGWSTRWPRSCARPSTSSAGRSCSTPAPRSGPSASSRPRSRRRSGSTSRWALRPASGPEPVPRRRVVRGCMTS